MLGCALPTTALANTPDASSTDPTPPQIAEPSDNSRLYRTREEKREAGLKHQVTPWLTLAGLAEAEYLREDFDIDGGRDDASDDDESITVQLGAEIVFSDVSYAEVVIEYDTDVNDVQVDEAVLILEHDPWEIALGTQYTPLGTYFSHFVSGPLLEFGETRAKRVATLVYSPIEQLDLSLTAYRGDARENRPGARRWDWDWAMAMELEAGDHWSIGWSYQSDLADAESRPLEDVDHRYARRVPAMSGYLMWSGEQFEVTIEALGALRPFVELDPDRDRPSAWNIEAAHFIDDLNLELAVRLEGSRELEDEPHRQYGVALTWRFARHAVVSLEYLHGEFRGELASNDDDIPYRDVDRIGALLSVEF